MNQTNLFLIIFVLALVVLSLWWAFNTIRQIQLQKEFMAIQLVNTAKLWRKSKYVPEDAKERESLYLYQDFLSKFEDDEQYPIMVKNGGVRCMTRQEYDRLCHQKEKWPVSILISILSVTYLVLAIMFNTNDLWFGLGIGAVMPALQILLAVFISRFKREKNKYREKLFMELRENCTDFLLLTKPFIIVDAYPQKFGKDAKPRYLTAGDITEEQIRTVTDYVVLQKNVETKVVMKSTKTLAEQKAMEQAKIQDAVNKALAEQEQQVQQKIQSAVEAVKAEQAKQVQPVPPAQPTPVTPVIPNDAKPDMPTLTKEEQASILSKMLEDHIKAERQRQQNDEPSNRPAPIPVPTEPTAPAPEPAPEAPAEPDPNDFSLDSIGIALDAELAKRRNNKK